MYEDKSLSSGQNILISIMFWGSSKCFLRAPSTNNIPIFHDPVITLMALASNFFGLISDITVLAIPIIGLNNPRRNLERSATLKNENLIAFLNT